MGIWLNSIPFRQSVARKNNEGYTLEHIKSWDPFYFFENVKVIFDMLFYILNTFVVMIYTLNILNHFFVIFQFEKTGLKRNIKRFYINPN